MTRLPVADRSEDRGVQTAVAPARRAGGVFPWRPSNARAQPVAWLVLLALQAGSPEPSTAPPEPELVAARGGRGGGGGGKTTDIKVSALDPDTVPADTALTIRVLGSGFTPGSQVSWALAGSPTTKVATTGPVSFVSSSELRAPVTVQEDAPLASYDVVVTAVGGKKGIGVEMLEVVAKLHLLPEPDWAVSSSASDVNDERVIVGSASDAADNIYALRWTPLDDSWTVEVLGVGSAAAINDDGYIVRRYYDTSARVWYCSVITRSGAEVDFGGAYIHGISNTGTLIGWIEPNGEYVAVAWRQLTPTTWGPPIVLPAAGGNEWGTGLNGISDNDDIAGYINRNGQEEWAVVWEYAGGQWNPPVLVDTELGGTAFAVNVHGASAGASWPCWDPNGGCPSQPSFWAAVGAPRQLLADPFYGAANGWVTALVHDMNNSNQIVGTARVPLGRRKAASHAVLWPSPASEEPVDLGAVVATWSSEAVAISDAGLVVGVSRMPNRNRHAVAWRLP